VLKAIFTAHTLIVALPRRWLISAFGDEIAPDLADQIDALRTQDVGAIEFRAAWGTNVIDLAADELARAHQQLTEAEIAVSAIGSPVGKAPIGGAFDSELARLRAALKAARALDTHQVRIFSFFIPDGRHQEYRTEVMRRMATFAKEAERADMRLVHENESYIYGDDAERCRDLIESVGSQALKIAFDPANFVQVGVRPYDEAWPLLAQHVAHFHVKDAVAVDRRGVAPYPAPAPELQLMASVRPAGQGEGQLPELLRALDTADYQGFLVIEPHLQSRLQDMDGAARFGVALAALRKLMAGVQN
jgi:3-dehydroshikimate dehydratase